VNTQPELITTEDGAAVIIFEDAVVALKVHRLVQLDAQLKAAKDARDELVAELVEDIDAAGGSLVADGIKVTVVRPVRRVIDLAQLELVASRRLFAKLTKRVVDIKAFDAHVQAGTTGIEAVEAIVTEVESAPSLRITK
jgi:hypothetical protein